jgi:alpha-1,2-mannosyltransferase
MILSEDPPSVTRLQRLATEGNRWAVPKMALSHALFGVVPLLLTLDLLYYAFVSMHIGAVDFHHEFWPAGQRVLHGLSPYSPSWMNIPGGVAFPYPAFTALAFVPFALLSHSVADGIFTAINLLAALLTLRVLNVRDWRLYGLVMMWPAVVVGWQSANLTLLLGLGIACLWRKRDHPLVAGAIVAALISLKPSIWPLGLWLLATRRYRALAYTVACGLAINAVSWAVLGFHQVHGYLQILSAVSSVGSRRGYSVTSFVMHVGGGRGIAYALGIAVALALATACLLVGRRGDPRSALALCIAVCLLGTPVLHDHYFALLVVPLALFRPQLDGLWLLPLVMWVCPENGARPWQILVALSVSAILVGLLLRPPRISTSVDEGTITSTSVDEGVHVPGPVRELTVLGSPL